jgi:aldehyde dehydrogenase (NAD+)
MSGKDIAARGAEPARSSPPETRPAPSIPSNGPSSTAAAAKSAPPQSAKSASPQSAKSAPSKSGQSGQGGQGGSQNLARAGAAPQIVFGDAWKYEPAPEATDHIRLQPRYELFIGGAWRQPLSQKYFDTVSPSTEEKLAEVAEANEADVDLAVQAARTAYEKYWSKLRPIDRGKFIYRIARALQEKARELAIVETMDGGKPIKESRDVDLPLAAAHFFYYAGWADKLEYAFSGQNPRPLGVAGQVIPWNFPLLMAAWKLAPALAAGNTCVLKPAETTPLTSLLLAKIIEEADLPPGVVNIVTGAGETGAALVRHPGVDKIAFTGSTEVGKRIQRAVAGTDKKLTLELGGKAANILFADAPIDQAIEGIIGAIYFNQGHVCCAGSRLLVEESAHDLVIRKLKDRMATLRLGDPLDKNTDVGAINSKMQLDKITELVAAGEKEGATRFTVGCPLPSRGFWFAPTVFTGVSQSHRIAREEIFGPVLSVLTFRTPEEAVEKANNTMYGLSAGVWTDKGSKSFWVAQRLKAGVVWANTYNKFDPSAPFGGYKESGFGREGGRQGLLAYLEVD